jgi:hypothetical protein
MGAEIAGDGGSKVVMSNISFGSSVRYWRRTQHFGCPVRTEVVPWKFLKCRVMDWNLHTVILHSFLMTQQFTLLLDYRKLFVIEFVLVFIYNIYNKDKTSAVYFTKNKKRNKVPRSQITLDDSTRVEWRNNCKYLTLAPAHLNLFQFTIAWLIENQI